MPLSDATARTAKPRDAAYKISDAGGLYMLVAPTGNRLWRMDYRFDGKRKTLALGQYPAIGLSAARQLREDVKRNLLTGVDPAARIKAERSAATETRANTFLVIAREYLETMRGEKRTPKTVAKNEWLLLVLAAEMHHKPISEIRSAEVLALLKKIESSGRIETSHRVRAAIGAVFRFAIRTDRAETDPTQALRGALLSYKHTPQAAIVDEPAFGRLLKSVDEYDGWWTLTAALQIMALCYPRPVELRKAEWSHIDLKNRVWLVPEHLAKMRRPHTIPLSRQAMVIFERLRDLGGDSGLVFPSIRNVKRPLSENAMNSALRRMGYEKDEHSSHGFRASASSILNDRGYRYDVIEASLAHLDGNEVRRTYNRTLYLKERTEMAQAWADICDDLKQTRRRSDDLI